MLNILMGKRWSGRRKVRPTRRGDINTKTSLKKKKTKTISWANTTMQERKKGLGKGEK